MSGAVGREASFAVGPGPRDWLRLAVCGDFGALGAVAAAKSFERTKDADRRWLITTRWATFGLSVGVVLLVILKALGVP